MSDEKELAVKLGKLGACNEAVEWARGKFLIEAWETCERADWMLWLVGHMCGTDGWPTRQDIVLVACLCAETALPFFEKKYPNDDRPRKAIEAARAWARGECDIEEVRKARRAPNAADAAAYATRRDSLKSMAQIVRENLKIPVSGAHAHTG